MLYFSESLQNASPDAKYSATRRSNVMDTGHNINILQILFLQNVLLPIIQLLEQTVLHGCILNKMGIRA